MFVRIAALLLAVCLCSPSRAADPASWTTPIAPFRIADNLYYVGSEDLASYLVTTPQGHILINANVASSPPLIKASVERLGYRWGDIKVLLNSQAHSDHVGGTAAIVRETKAQVMAMDGDVEGMETGGKADFVKTVPLFEPVKVDRVLRDGDTVSLGGITLTARKTAGHTRGCTTWVMRAHVPGEPKETLRTIVIAGGTTFWPEFHFVPTSARAESYPGIAADFEATFATLRSLQADVFLGAHGVYFDMSAKLKQYPTLGARAFVDPDGYKTFVAAAEQKFQAELAKQRADAR